MMRRRERDDGFILEHAHGSLEVREVAAGIVFLKYRGLVVNDCFDASIELPEAHIAAGRKLHIFIDALGISGFPAQFRRSWLSWLTQHTAQLDQLVLLYDSPVLSLASQTLSPAVRALLRGTHDAEDFQARLEDAVVSAFLSQSGSGQQDPHAAATKTDMVRTRVEAEHMPSSTLAPEGDMLSTKVEAATAAAAHQPPDDSQMTPFVGAPGELGAARRRAAQSSSSDTPPPHAPGSLLFGRYELLYMLGRGGMGVVYAALDRKLEREVAIKLLHAHERPDARSRFVREARVMAKLSHPNVIPIYDAGEVDQQAYIVMERIEGDTVANWAKREDPRWHRIVDVFCDAGRGLAAAHAKQLIHRDFKPTNLMVGKDERVVVMDFGLACFEPSAQAGGAKITSTGTILGTPAYMAPEQLLAGTVTAQTDQFSFCVGLWELLHGERPFRGSDLGEIRNAVISGGPERPRQTNVPAALTDILERGLAYDAAARWESMDALIKALTRARRAARRGRLIRWVRRR